MKVAMTHPTMPDVIVYSRGGLDHASTSKETRQEIVASKAIQERQDST